MSTGKRGYEFTVQGKYYADNEHGKTSLKFYRGVKFILPEISTYIIGKKWETYKIEGPEGKGQIEKKRAVPNVKRQNTLKCFKYMIKNYYLDVKLREELPDYVRFQTFQITKRKEVKLTQEKMTFYPLPDGQCPGQAITRQLPIGEDAGDDYSAPLLDVGGDEVCVD